MFSCASPFVHAVQAVTDAQDVCPQTNLTTAGLIATRCDDDDGHAHISRSYFLTGQQDAASSLPWPAASSHLLHPSRPATLRIPKISSDATVGPCFPAPEVPTTVLQQPGDVVMTAAHNANSSSHSQSLAGIDLLQRDNAMPKDGRNDTIQTGVLLWSATCPPTEHMHLPWTVPKPIQLNSRTGYPQVGRACWLV